MENQSEGNKCDMCLKKTKDCLTFTCRHKICYICLYQLLITKYINDIISKKDIEIKCLCFKGKIILSLDSIERILTDLYQRTNDATINNLYNKIEDIEEMNCKNHPDCLQNYYCLDCKDEICEKCFEDKKCKHYEHKIINKKNYCEFLKTQIEDFPNLDKLLDNFNKNYEESLLNYKNEVSKKFENIINEINLTKEKIFKEIDNKINYFAKLFNIIGLLYRVYNYEIKNFKNEMHKLMFLYKTQIKLPEINFHFKQSEIEFDKIKKNLEKIDLVKYINVKMKKKFNNFECIQTLNNKDQSIIKTICLLDSIKLATGDTFGNLKIYKMTKKGYDLFQKEKISSSEIKFIIKLKDKKFAITSCLNKILIWKENNKNNYKTISILSFNNEPLIYPMAINSLQDKESLLTFMNDNTIRIYKNTRNDNYELYQKFVGINNSINIITNIIHLTDGSILASGDSQNLYLWDKNKKLNLLYGHTNTVNVIIEADENTIFSGGSDNNIIIWKKNNESLFEVNDILIGHIRAVKAITYLNDGRIVSGGEDNYIKLWVLNNNNKYTCNITFRKHKDFISGLVHIDDNTFISCSYDKTIKTWVAINLLI